MPDTDRELVRRFAGDGDEAAFRLLVERHAAAALRVAFAITRDHQAAEDATQETFLAVSRGLRKGRYEPGRSLRAWIVGIAAKRALNVARGRRRALRREERHAMTDRRPQPGPRETAQHEEVREHLAIALRDLSPKSRAVLDLHYREGMTHAEVAAALGIARGTVKSRLARALDALRERLGTRAFSVAALPALLAELPAPEPSADLLAACAAKATAGPAGIAVALKATAAVAVIGAATVVTVLAVSEPERPARMEREANVPGDVTRRDVAPRDAHGAPVAAKERNREVEPVAPDATGSADPAAGVQPADPVASPTGGGKDEPGRVVNVKDLPEGVQVVRGSSSGGTGPGPGVKPGRFQPMGGGRGWTKYAPPPRHRGEATLKGRVLDSAGTPVEGAEIYRMPLDVDREASTVVSFEFLTKVAKTGADGTFAAGKQEHGTFLLVANYQRRMNRPRGMETRDAVVVQVQEKGTAENLVLRLPFNVGESVPLRGVVTDADGKPVRGAQVFLDYQELRTGADGAFDAGKVAVGTHSVVVRRTGYVQLEGEVVAERGRDNVAKLVLELERSGELRLAGLVLDTEGNPVKDATVYLNNSSRTIRRVRTDDKGAYAFEKLPEELADGGCSINVWVSGYFPKRVNDVPVPADPYEIRVDRAHRLLVKVVSDADGSPLQQTRGEARREMVVDGRAEFRMFRSWSTFKEDGVLDLTAPAGKLQLEIEAPGHAVTTLVIEVSGGDEPQEIEVRLPIAPGKPEGE
jgi:RNA polymerase sigma-70 factor (ECF subfamily)